MTISLSGTGHRAPNSLQFGSSGSEDGWRTVTSKRKTKQQPSSQAVTGPTREDRVAFRTQPSSTHQSKLHGNRFALLSFEEEGSDSEKPSSPLPSRREGHSLDIDEEPSSPFLVGRRVHHGPFASLSSRRDDHSSFSRLPSRATGIGFDEEDDEEQLFLSSSQHERLAVGAKKGKKVEKANGEPLRKPKSSTSSKDFSWSVKDILSMVFSPLKALFNWLASWCKN